MTIESIELKDSKPLTRTNAIVLGVVVTFIVSVFAFAFV